VDLAKYRISVSLRLATGGRFIPESVRMSQSVGWESVDASWPALGGEP